MKPVGIRANTTALRNIFEAKKRPQWGSSGAFHGVPIRKKNKPNCHSRQVSTIGNRSVSKLLAFSNRARNIGAW